MRGIERRRDKCTTGKQSERQSHGQRGMQSRGGGDLVRVGGEERARARGGEGRKRGERWGKTESEREEREREREGVRGRERDISGIHSER